MRYHPLAGAPSRRPGFGFEEIMATPDHGRFRRWYDRASFFAPSPERSRS